MRQHRHDDDDAFDENGLLRDGARLHVPMFAMDGMDPVQRAVAQSVRIVDAQGGTAGLHRPGFRIAANDARKRTTHYDPKGRLKGYSETEIEEDDEETHGTERQTSDARQRAYDAYERDLVTSYRNPVGFGGDPSIAGVGEHGLIGQREGGPGMLDYEENAEDIVRNAAPHTESARRCDHRTVAQMMRDHQNNMADLYDKLDRELSEAWRRRS